MKNLSYYFYHTLSCLILSLVFCVQSNALTIVLNDVGLTPMAPVQLAAFRSAADAWENSYTDPITVYVNIAFNDLDSQTLGSTLTARTTHTFSTVRSAMQTDATSAITGGFQNEANAVNDLPTGTVPVNIFSGGRNDSYITLATANAKALGLGTARDPLYGGVPLGTDFSIEFNTDHEATFDYDPSDGISSGQSDFVAVAKHEIAHGLGFISATDIQDYNTGYTIRTHTLDLWRFNETGGGHTLSTEPRKLTKGDAEHWDSSLNNEPYSHGKMDYDPVCNGSNNRCQASHWSDDQGNLMDPTLTPGVAQDITSPDLRAIDYIGYNRPQLFICCFELIPLWDFWWFWPIDPPPFFENPDFPVAPELPSEIPEWANLGWVSIMDLGPLGRRSGVGFARFDMGGQIGVESIQPAEDVPGEMNLNPSVPPMVEKPPALYEMTFISDQESGVPFSFSATCGELGCEYDPTIGEFGGYRIPGFIDAEGDGKQDVDGRFTLVLAADEQKVPNADGQNLFKLDERSNDSTITITDYEAFGIETPQDSDNDGVIDSVDNCTEVENTSQLDTNNDGFGNACDPDLNNDGTINFQDVALFAGQFNSTNGGDADFNGDGVVNFGDYSIVPAYFLGAPGPSGVNP